MFIMELPPYRMPSFRSLMIHTWEKGKHFLMKAGTYIFAFSIIIWFLLHLPWGVESKKDSYLGKIGQIAAPALKPMGSGKWEAASSLMAGIVAKEIVVGTMAEIYVPKEADKKGEAPSLADDLKEVATSFGDATRQSFANIFSTFGFSSLSTEESTEKAAERNPLRKELRNQFTPLAAYAFLTFVLLYLPCIVALVAMVQELGSLKWFGVTFIYQMSLAWGMSCLVYQGGKLLGLG